MARRPSRPGEPITNFGGNVRFVPRCHYTPRTELEVLEILDRHHQDRVRVMASLHSWSAVAVSDDVLIDVRYLDHVAVETGEDGSTWARVGGGCTLKRLLVELQVQADATLPTLGAVTEQTLAGAISTGTHGSGMSSLSHYMTALRVAAYDSATGKARIYEWTDGDTLRAARCALGCMGIVLEVRFRCISQYDIVETVTRVETLDEVFATEATCPLQQFVLLPYLWSYFVFRRRRMASRRERGVSRGAWLYRAYNLLVVDVLFHVTIKLLVSVFRHPVLTRGFYQKVAPLIVLQNKTVVDRSEEILTMEHELFRHEEMELFVPRSQLHEAVALVRATIDMCAGTIATPPDDVAAALERIGMLESLHALQGSYPHHYPLFFRRVLPDDTLISMTAGVNQPYYTISFFTYLAPTARQAFYAMVGFLAQALGHLYATRLHWGKYYPLTHAEIAPRFPQLEAFRNLCTAVDPRGVFRNDYTTQVLGFT